MDRFRLVRHLPGLRLRRPSWPRSAASSSGLARVVAPAVFLLAVTAVVLVVRTSLRSGTPAGVTTQSVTTARTRAASPTTRKPGAPKRWYVIRSGDTLSSIAAQLGTSVDELMRLNPGIEPTALRPGEQVRVR